MENEYNFMSCGCKVKWESSLYTYMERAPGLSKKQINKKKTKRSLESSI